MLKNQLTGIEQQANKERTRNTAWASRPTTDKVERRRGENAEKQDSPPVEHVFVKISSTSPMWHQPLPPKKTPVFSPWIEGRRTIEGRVAHRRARSSNMAKRSREKKKNRHHL
jgi:hypothetical protein